MKKFAFYNQKSLEVEAKVDHFMLACCLPDKSSKSFSRPLTPKMIFKKF